MIRVFRHFRFRKSGDIRMEDFAQERIFRFLKNFENKKTIMTFSATRDEQDVCHYDLIIEFFVD